MKTIIDSLKTQDNFALFTHVSPDGDAIGSLLSLGYTLKKLGKKADCFVCESIPKRLVFMQEDYGFEVFTENSGKKYDCAVALDCGDEFRLGEYKDMFFSAIKTVNIDHHRTNKGFANVNFVVPNASSTGEILFDVLDELKAWDKTNASLVFGAIASDTGCFCFQNTSPKTHIYAAKLIEYGANHVLYNRKLFSTSSEPALKAKAYTINNTELFFDGKAAVVCIDDETLFGMGCTKDETDGLIDIPRSIDGVEVAVLIKQQGNGSKVSLRTQEYVDAAAIAESFGGGGHIRAAGFSLDMGLKDAKDTVLKALEEYI